MIRIIILVLLYLLYSLVTCKPILQFPLAINYDNVTTTVNFILYEGDIIEDVVSRVCNQYNIIDCDVILEYCLSNLKSTPFFQNYELSKKFFAQMTDIKRYSSSVYDLEEDSANYTDDKALVTNSDEILVYIKDSVIDGAGLGLFSKRNITQGSIICEYRGQIVSGENQKKLLLTTSSVLNNDKWVHLSIWDKDYSIYGEGICPMINDCSNASKLLQNNESLLLETNYPSQCYEGLSYNVESVRIGSKIFCIAIRDIFMEEELFVSYGFSYWKAQAIIKKFH